MRYQRREVFVEGKLVRIMNEEKRQTKRQFVWLEPNEYTPPSWKGVKMELSVELYPERLWGKEVGVTMTQNEDGDWIGYKIEEFNRRDGFK